MGPGARLRAAMLLAGLLVGGIALHPAPALGADPAAAGGRTTRQRQARETPAGWHARRGLYLERNWGVDVVGVHPVSSGYMLRFDYRVVDPARAVVLTDRNTRPYLIDEATRTALAVPAMENVGELRQVAPLERNRTYYMIFGNPGKLVKRGSRVTIMVGDFRAEGLIVE